MSAVANIVLPDGQATPVNHTFVPLGPDKNGVWWWEDQSGTSAIGYNRISARLEKAPMGRPGGNAGVLVNKVTLGVYTPTLEVVGNSSTGITPPPTVAYLCQYTSTFILPDRSTTLERTTLNKFSAYFQSDTQIQNMILNLLNVY